MIAISWTPWWADLGIDRGRGIPWEGNYSSWLDQKTQRMGQEEKEESRRQKQLKQELEWVRSNAKARQAKGKARLAAYDKLQEMSAPEKLGSTSIAIPNGPRLGDNVIKAENLTKAYGDKLLFENLVFDLPKAGIVGIIGPNGAGKTTLFRMITGQEQPDGGKLSVGESVKLSYVDQSRDSLNGENTVFQEITGDVDTIKVGGLEINARLRGQVQLQRQRPTAAGENPIGRAAQPRIWRSCSCRKET